MFDIAKFLNVFLGLVLRYVEYALESLRTRPRDLTYLEFELLRIAKTAPKKINDFAIGSYNYSPSKPPAPGPERG